MKHNFNHGHDLHLYCASYNRFSRKKESVVSTQKQRFKLSILLKQIGQKYNQDTISRLMYRLADDLIHYWEDNIINLLNNWKQVKLELVNYPL